MKIDDIAKQADDIEVWLRDNAPDVFNAQKHLDEDTAERAYWHYGRLIALRDVIRAMAQ